MSWFRPLPAPVLDWETLKKETFDFPSEIPIIGQTVKAVYFTDDKGSVSRLETTVLSRKINPESVFVEVSCLEHGDRIGTQELKCFKWDRASKKWFFWHKYDDKYRPAILMF